MLVEKIFKKLNLKTALKLFSFVLLAVFLFGFFSPIAWAQDTFGLQQAQVGGLGAVNLITVIVRIVQILLGLLGIIAVIIIMYAGYLWMMAAGDPAKVDKAKKIIKDAIIGLIIILSAFTIVSFIIRALTGGGSGNGSAHPGGANDWGRWGIGAGPIQSVYPAPGQRDVPINTWIAVTFKEDVDPATLCESLVDGRCQNSKMKNVEICQLDNLNNCETSGDFTILALADAKVSNRAGDKKTYVFTPNRYLGLQDFQDRVFKVLLKEGIKRVSDNQSVLEVLPSHQYYWAFTTNGELDLDPPEVVSTNTNLNPAGIDNISGVYPNPDNAADTFTLGSGPTPTKFNIKISNFFQIREAVDASFEQPVKEGTSPDATLSGNYGGTESGRVRAQIGSDGRTVTVTWPGSMGIFTSQYTGGQVINIGPYGLTFRVSAVPGPASSWIATTTAQRIGDSIDVLENSRVINTYVFGKEITAPDAAVIASLIIDDNKNIFSSCGARCIRTIETGPASKRYVIRSSASQVVIAKDDGAEAVDNVAVHDKRDVPRNTIFQINFNEPINPVFIDNIIIKSVGASIAGFQTEISNQYRTLEFTGPEECGTNSCGDTIYCWPVNGVKTVKYEIEAAASKLMIATDPRCGQWGGSPASKNRCSKNLFGQAVFYPGTDSPDGLVDMAGNSFNGSFNAYEENGKVYGISEGRSGAGDGHSGKGAYYLNTSTPLYAPSSSYGDNFSWSFFVSEKIDKQSPLLKQIGPDNMRGDQETADFTLPVEFGFDRIMRSATLKPGYNYGDQNDKRSRSQRYLLLETLTPNQNPVGYWVSNIGQDINEDNLPDTTLARVSHSVFDPFVEYGPLAGSGLQSITQNCFLPSAGPESAGSGVCAYTGTDSQSGCVDVDLPNPASYGKMNCLQIKGTQVCEGDPDNHICKVLYYDKGKPETDLAGSWVLTNDYSRRSDGEIASGCCFGVCVKK